MTSACWTSSPQYGGPGYDNVITNFVPLLRERGVTEEQIHTMTVVNPGRAFAYDAEAARTRAAAQATRETTRRAVSARRSGHPADLI